MDITSILIIYLFLGRFAISLNLKEWQLLEHIEKAPVVIHLNYLVLKQLMQHLNGALYKLKLWRAFFISFSKIIMLFKE